MKLSNDHGSRADLDGFRLISSSWFRIGLGVVGLLLGWFWWGRLGFGLLSVGLGLVHGGQHGIRGQV